MLERVEVGQYYRNKKTQEVYQVFGFIIHSETLETMVRYIAIKDLSKEWARPLELFKEKFEEL
jgi:hypothetical protein